MVLANGNAVDAHMRDWMLAVLFKLKATAMRRNRDFVGAHDYCEKAIRTFPRYKDALQERAFVWMDEGLPEKGKNYLEMILKMDRKYQHPTGLSDSLILSHTLDKRKWKAQNEHDPSNDVKGHLPPGDSGTATAGGAESGG